MTKPKRNAKLKLELSAYYFTITTTMKDVVFLKKRHSKQETKSLSVLCMVFPQLRARFSKIRDL